VQTRDTQNLINVLTKYETPWPPAHFPTSANFEGADDEMLLRILKKGTKAQREDAFLEIYNRNYLYLFRTIKVNDLNDAEVKDIFSDVWEIFIRELPKFKWKGIPIKHFLASIQRRKVLEYINKRKRNRDNTISLDYIIDSRAISYIEEKLDPDKLSSSNNASPKVLEIADNIIDQCHSLLSDRDRKIILSRYYLNNSTKQIAQSFNMNPGAVRTALSRALNKIRKHWSSINNGE